MAMAMGTRAMLVVVPSWVGRRDPFEFSRMRPSPPPRSARATRHSMGGDEVCLLLLFRVRAALVVLLRQWRQGNGDKLFLLLLLFMARTALAVLLAGE